MTPCGRGQWKSLRDTSPSGFRIGLKRSASLYIPTRRAKLSQLPSDANLTSGLRLSSSTVFAPRISIDAWLHRGLANEANGVINVQLPAWPFRGGIQRGKRGRAD